MFLHRILFWPLFALSTLAQLSAIEVLSYRYGPTDQGANTNETILTLDKVNPWNFGLKATVPVDGQIYAAPLIKSVSSQKSLAIVCTMSNVIKAVDTANPSNPSNGWTLVLTNNGQPVPSDDTGSWDIWPLIGICSTPVIDASGYLYVVAKAKRMVGSTPAYNYTIYKINSTNGALVGSNKFAETLFDGSNYSYRTNPATNGVASDPYVIGTGDGSIGVTVTNMVAGKPVTKTQNRVYFNALRQLNRPGLTLLKGNVYVGFASHGDNGPYHGWVLGFNTANLALSAVLNTTPNGGLGGTWQSGGCITSDGNNLYFETGNGSFDSYNLNQRGFPVDANYGDCIIKVTPNSSTLANPNPNGWGLSVTDYFTPYNNDSINWADLDVGSCGPVFIQGAKTNFILATGKDGTFYSLNSTNMGKFNPYADQVITEIPQAVGQGRTWTAFSTPSYINGQFFYFGADDYGKQFQLSPSSGVISSWYNDDNGTVQTDVSTSFYDGGAYAWPGANTSISANGSNNVILWAIHKDANLLRAYRASDMLNIWNSNASPADDLGGAIKFSVPIVANGQVFVGTDGALKIYGLTPAQRH
jgi:hypothetical protein